MHGAMSNGPCRFHHENVDSKHVNGWASDVLPTREALYESLTLFAWKVTQYSDKAALSLLSGVPRRYFA